MKASLKGAAEFWWVVGKWAVLRRQTQRGDFEAFCCLFYRFVTFSWWVCCRKHCKWQGFAMLHVFLWCRLRRQNHANTDVFAHAVQKKHANKCHSFRQGLQKMWKHAVCGVLIFFSWRVCRQHCVDDRVFATSHAFWWCFGDTTMQIPMILDTRCKKCRKNRWLTASWRLRRSNVLMYHWALSIQIPLANDQQVTVIVVMSFCHCCHVANA